MKMPEKFIFKKDNFGKLGWKEIDMDSYLYSYKRTIYKTFSNEIWSKFIKKGPKKIIIRILIVF